MRIMVTGSAGQLGHELLRLPGDPGIERVGLDRRRLDVTDRAAVLDAVTDVSPDVVVNCAAFAAVDAAEADRDAAFAVNRGGAAILAEACAARRRPLIHLSTDYVFDGEKGSPYVEDDATGPLNVYGASKAAGEAAVRERLAEHLILRTSWLYGAHGGNFVKTMLRLAATQAEIPVVDDQQGCPTAAPDLAAVILVLARRAAGGDCAWGTYHCCNAGETSWFGFASAILEDQGGAARLVPVATAAFPRPASRPRRSTLDCRRLAARFGIEMRPWRAALAGVLREIKTMREVTE